jgi:hypothetical protein
VTVELEHAKSKLIMLFFESLMFGLLIFEN